MVPLEGPLQDWAEAEGISLEWEQLCKDPRTKKHLLDELKTTAQEKKVRQTLQSVQKRAEHNIWFCFVLSVESLDDCFVSNSMEPVLPLRSSADPKDGFVTDHLNVHFVCIIFFQAL